MRGQLIAVSKRTSQRCMPRLQSTKTLLLSRCGSSAALKARHFVVNHHAFNRSNLPRQAARSSAFQVAA